MLENARSSSSARRMLLAAVAMFVAITVVRLLVTAPGWGITLLYDVPVALVAVAFGLRSGLVAAVVGLALYALVDITRPILVNGVEVHQNAAGYVSRAIVFFVLGGLLGVFADRLRDTERMLGRVLDATRDPIITADGDGLIVGFNRAAEATFGRPSHEVVGLPLTTLMPERFQASHRAGLRRYLENGEAHVIGQTTELVAVRAGGREFPMELSLSTFELGGRPFFTGVVADITERKRAERDRAAHQANLERSNTELEQFAYIASHDLQEPLRSISGFTTLLEKRYKGQLDDDADRFIGFVTSGVERMQALINGLLAYSRAGRDDLAGDRIDLNEVVAGAVAALDAARAEAGGEVHVGDLPTVTGDAAALGSVFQNLVGNALKFTNGAPPRIDIDAERGAGGWTVSVRDNGIGIEPAHAERIFRMFQRLHGRDGYGGTGIGLAVSRTMIERQGGRIWCEAPPSGPGSVFRVFLPDAQPDA